MCVCVCVCGRERARETDVRIHWESVSVLSEISPWKRPVTWGDSGVTRVLPRGPAGSGSPDWSAVPSDTNEGKQKKWSTKVFSSLTLSGDYKGFVSLNDFFPSLLLCFVLCSQKFSSRQQKKYMKSKTSRHEFRPTFIPIICWQRAKHDFLHMYFPSGNYGNALCTLHSFRRIKQFKAASLNKVGCFGRRQCHSYADAPVQLLI